MVSKTADTVYMKPKAGYTLNKETIEREIRNEVLELNPGAKAYMKKHNINPDSISLSQLSNYKNIKKGDVAKVTVAYIKNKLEDNSISGENEEKLIKYAVQQIPTQTKSYTKIANTFWKLGLNKQAEEYAQKMINNLGKGGSNSGLKKYAKINKLGALGKLDEAHAAERNLVEVYIKKAANLIEKGKLGAAWWHAYSGLNKLSEYKITDEKLKSKLMEYVTQIQKLASEKKTAGKDTRKVPLADEIKERIGQLLKISEDFERVQLSGKKLKKSA